MKKIIFLSVIFLQLFFVSCEKESENEEPEKYAYVIIANDFNRSRMNDNVTDGTIYEMYLIAKDYSYVTVPAIKIGNTDNRKLDMNKFPGSKFIVFFKVAPYPSAVPSQQLRCILGDNNKAKEFVLKESKAIDVAVSENTKSANMKGTTVDEVLGYVKQYYEGY